MEKVEIRWKLLVEDDKKAFYKLILSNSDDKYYIFCYIGSPKYMDNPKYKGEKFKKCVLYLKKKVNKREYETLFKYAFKKKFYISVSYICNELISNKIFSEERKDKIQKLLIS